MAEQKYIFVDNTGHCFEDFQDKDDGSGYNDRVGAMLRGKCEFGVGEMLCFRDELLAAGFQFPKDFYVRKIPNF